MKPFGMAFAFVRIIGLMWLIIGFVMVILDFIGLMFLPRVEEIYPVLGQYFVTGILNLVGGLVLFILAKPIAKLAVRGLNLTE